MHVYLLIIHIIPVTQRFVHFQNFQGVVTAAEPCLEESIAELDVFMRGDTVGDKVKSSDDVITWLEVSKSNFLFLDG